LNNAFYFFLTYAIYILERNANKILLFHTIYDSYYYTNFSLEDKI